MPFASSLEYLVARTGILDHSPLWALVFAFAALALYAWFRTPRLLAAAALWIAYIPFEFAMRAEWFCHGQCLPRIDLLPAIGFLCAASLVALAEVLVLAFRDILVRWPKRSGKRILDRTLPGEERQMDRRATGGADGGTRWKQ
jgi:hypothetical protein